MVRVLLSKAKEEKAFICFPPMDETKLRQTNEVLTDICGCLLPEDFCTFLMLCDGLYYDGLEFFGTTEHPRPAKNYIFTNIINANKPFSEYTFFSKKIIIGRLSENFILYDSKNNLFAIIDRINLCSQIEFSSFENLFSYLLQHCGIYS